MAEAEYLEILDWLARDRIAGKRGYTPQSAPPVLERLGIEPTLWSAMVKEFGRAFMNVAGTAKSVWRLAVAKRIASSTERGSKQRSRRPILQLVALQKCLQRWLSALISNEWSRNRETGPILRAVRAEIISNRWEVNQDRKLKCRVPTMPVPRRVRVGVSDQFVDCHFCASS